MKFSTLFIAGLSIVFVASEASADIFLSAAADGQVQQTATDTIADDTLNTVQTSRSGGNNVFNGIFEFDLSGIATGTTVSAAVIELELASNTSNITSTVNLKVGQYNGDGVVSATDFADYGDFAGTVETYNRTSSGGPGIGSILSINLDTSLIQAILDDTNLDYFGLRTATENFATFQFVSNEGAAVGDLAPRLVLTAVPEPSSLVIFALGCCATLMRRRKSA